jgi:hypothetical protein
MPKEDVIARIEAAFRDTPSPGSEYDDIAIVKYWDEGIVDYFRGTSWRGHNVQALREHDCALSYFTAKAFRYWLPAFMLVELEHPVEADIIAEGIAFHLTETDRTDEKLGLFAKDELEAIAAFLDECVRRYEDDRDDGQFRQAANAVRARIQKA